MNDGAKKANLKKKKFLDASDFRTIIHNKLNGAL